MLEVQRLYPQYKVIKDRRQQNVPVDNDRRSGMERRSAERPALDTNLTRDIFEIKSKVAQFEGNKTNPTDRITFTQNSSKAAQNSIKADQFIKTTKNDNNTPSKSEQTQAESAAPLVAGVFACVMGGIVSAAFVGPLGVGISLAIGTYFGAKLLSQAIKSQSNDSTDTKK